MRYWSVGIFFFALICVPAYAADSDLETRIKKLEQRVDGLENELRQLKGISRKPSKTTKTKSKKNKLTLNDWNFSVVSGDYSQYYEITVKLHNGFSKDIKLIDISLRFTDLLGSKLYSIKIGPDMHIPASGIGTDTGRYSINRFITEQHRMKKNGQERHKNRFSCS